MSATDYLDFACFRGLAHLRVPESWVADCVALGRGDQGEAVANFGPHGQFRIRVTHDGPQVRVHVTRDADDVPRLPKNDRSIGPFEPLKVAMAFGASHTIYRLDEV